MRLFKIVLVVLLVAGIANWIRQGQGFSILESLPIVGGHALTKFDVAAGVMILIAIWGIARTARGDDDDTDESRYGVDEDDD